MLYGDYIGGFSGGEEFREWELKISAKGTRNGTFLKGAAE
jgi:hypothetical protein